MQPQPKVATENCQDVTQTFPWFCANGFQRSARKISRRYRHTDQYYYFRHGIMNSATFVYQDVARYPGDVLSKTFEEYFEIFFIYLTCIEHFFFFFQWINFCHFGRQWKQFESLGKERMIQEIYCNWQNEKLQFHHKNLYDSVYVNLCFKIRWKITENS